MGWFNLPLQIALGIALGSVATRLLRPLPSNGTSKASTDWPHIAGTPRHRMRPSSRSSSGADWFTSGWGPAKRVERFQVVDDPPGRLDRASRA